MIGFKQNLIAAIKDDSSEVFREDIKSEYQVLFLSQVVPDPENARFLPAIKISDYDANLFAKRKLTKKQIVKLYDAENHVLVGKSVFINCLEYGSDNWKDASENIKSIINLAENIGVSEVIQAPTVFKSDSGDYQVLTGHRRFFAMLYLQGTGGAAQFKVYGSPPLLIKTKQFQENSSREDLSQAGKLKAFQNAFAEIESLSQARQHLGRKKLTVRETANLLGISMGAFDNYNVLTRYQTTVRAYENGWQKSFVQTKKIILDIENTYKKENDKTVLNIGDRRNIESQLKDIFFKKGSSGSQRPVSYKITGMSSPETVKKLLELNIFSLDLGIDWESLDWSDMKSVNHTIETIISALEKK